jgi:two-component system, OmpR family, heavy metal sensor histidine kinase CusS
MKRPLSLAARVTLLVGPTTIAVLVIFGIVVQGSMNNHFVEQDSSELQVVADSVEQTLNDRTVLTTPETRLAAAVRGHHGIFFVVTDTKDGELYNSYGPTAASIMRQLRVVDTISPELLSTWMDDGHTFRGALIARAHHRILVATMIDFHIGYLSDFSRRLWIYLIFCGIATMLAAWIAVHQGHAPLRRISQEIGNITSSSLNTRLDPAVVPVELAELVTAFNTMLQRIETVFVGLSNFSADIAHELRTPLTNLTTQSQVVLAKARDAEEYREILYSSLEEFERLSHMINDMLLLAQTDNKLLTLSQDVVDLNTEVAQLTDYFSAWAEEKNIVIQVTGSVPAICGDQSMVRRALSNLITNAVRHSSPGSPVAVQLSSDETFAQFRIVNDGPVILPQHLPHLFDRFYRIDTARTRVGEAGAGLGLSLVKSIVEAHGGTVSVQSSRQQTVFMTRWPASRAPTMTVTAQAQAARPSAS